MSATGLPKRARAAAKSFRFLNNETDPNTIAFLKQMVSDYKAASGINIQLETVPVLETWTKVTTAIKAGKPYDFITFGQITDPLLLAKDNLLVPLTAIIKDIGVEDFGPRALDWYRNELWMYPYDYNFNYLIYRKDWFAEKHLQPATDWKGFKRMLEASTTRRKSAMPLPCPFPPGDTPTGVIPPGCGPRASNLRRAVECNARCAGDKTKGHLSVGIHGENAQYTPPGCLR